MRRHLGIDTGVISARQDRHGDSGVRRAPQLMGNLSDLLVRASAKEDLGNPLVAVLVLRAVFG